MRLSSVLFLSAMSFSSICYAAENVVDESKSKDLAISIYNNNLALVKDIREVNLQAGLNNVAFQGVATRIKPESVLVFGDGINVLEQNYDYDLLTAQNIIEKSVGTQVKTVVENPTTGENMFDSAKVISANYGAPILEFSYGIEAQFPGRVVFEKLPEGLRNKPTLIAKISSTSEAMRELSLAYLTNGISWKTNYVAKVTSDTSLDLTGWVAITNESGVDYAKAKVQLIAGDVNQVQNVGGIMPRANRMMMAKGMVMEAGVADTMSVPSQQISGYHLYTLPNKTDIKDNQTKQVSLLEKDGVKYSKEGRLTSSLYLGGEYKASFEKQHPAMIYIMSNTETDNLGLPLPSGVVRFYENDDSGNLQFVGENSISHVAKGEKMELNLGNFFNVYVDGKIANVTKVSEEKVKEEQPNNCQMMKVVRSYEAEVVFNNGGGEETEVVFVQNINQDTKMISQNIEGKAKNINEYEWRVNVPADGKKLLKFTAEVTSDERKCN